MIRLEIPGQPVPKGRPRFRNGKAYTPKATKEAEEVVSMWWVVDVSPAWRKDATYSLRLWFYMKDRRRVDGDNLEKLVKDALTGLAWEDDSQVVRCTWEKLYGAPEPKTVIEVEAL